MSYKIYICFHQLPDEMHFLENDEIYTPIFLGGHKAEYLDDTTGQNISKFNPYFCELTGQYWAWKNDDISDAKGICHYRRIIAKDDTHLFTQKNLDDIFITKGYDAISNSIPFKEKNPHTEENLKNSTWSGYKECHKIEDLNLFRDALKAQYPEYLETFDDAIMYGSQLSCGNLFMAKKDIFNKYSEWLFNNLFYVQERSKYLTYDPYNQRVFGFLTERISPVWMLYNNIKIYGCSAPNYFKNAKDGVVI